MLWMVDAHPDYQAGLNVPRLATEGYSALVVKATQGITGYGAPARFDTWKRQAQDAGMVFGAYHWLNGSDPIGQVDRFLNRIGDPEGMLIQFDIEDNASAPSWSIIQRATNRWNERTNHHPVLFYTGAWWWNVAGRNWNGAGLTPYLWHSHYVMDGAQPAAGFASSVFQRVPATWWQPGYGGWGSATVLQFTSRGTAGGITNNVDVNAFQGTPEQLRALTGQETNMVQITGPDPFDPKQEPQKQAAEIRDSWALLMAGYQPTDANENGVIARLDRIEHAPAVNVTLSDPAVVHAIATEVAGLLAPQFRNLDNIAQALGAYGDAAAAGDAALGKLNDPA